MLHRFQTASLFVSDTAGAGVSEAAGAFRLDYSFSGPGYAGIVFPCDVELPENYALEFEIRGGGPPQNLECKLVDPSGTTVWWAKTAGVSFPDQWSAMKVKKRCFSLAWGSEAPLAQMGRVEITVTSGEGGEGFIEVRNPLLREIAPSRSFLSSAKVQASSGDHPERLLGRQSGECWCSDAAEAQTIDIRFGDAVELGGLTIVWGDGCASAFDIALDDPERGWVVAERVTGFRGRKSFHYLPEAEARAIRISLHERLGRRDCYEIQSIELKGADFSASWGAFLYTYAAEKRRGLFPRYLSREQSYWTVVGANGGAQKALINEEGMIELGYELPSLEPFLVLNRSLQTWAECRHTQDLTKGFLPIPVVERTCDGLLLRVTAWMDCAGGNEILYVRYELNNTASSPRSGALYAAIRPYQVNPPWQFLNNPGGFQPVTDLEFEGGQTAIVNGRDRVIALHQAARAGACNFWAGDITELLDQNMFPEETRAEDAHGYCSGAFEFPFALQSGEIAAFEFACTYEGPGIPRDPIESLRETIYVWQSLLERAHFSVAAAPDLENTIKSQLAYILVNRNGAAIQPGTRCYRRTWIRDGALTSSALLQFGFTDEVRAFIRWFTPYISRDGKVPCVVDQRGADPTPEHDSHGEYLFLVSEYYRCTGDEELARELLPHIMRVIRAIRALSEETDRAELPEHVRRLLPKSISHEGYSSGPAYSYWDDLWGVRGLEGAAAMLRSLGALAEAEECAALRDEFTGVVSRSIELAMAHHGISFIPGAADLGDFDATSTTIGADPSTLLLTKFRPALQKTFDRYWEFFSSRKADFPCCVKYTPYEWRAVGALVRLGQSDRAHEALDFFLAHRRPAGWRHWAEVVWADERAAGFIGDAPHGWVGSDFLRAVRSLMIYELDGAWHIGEGIPFEWWRRGVSCLLPTPVGLVAVQSSLEGDAIRIEIEGPPALACRFHTPEGVRAISLPATVTLG